MINLTPFASKSKSYTNLTLNFDVSTLRINISENYGFYCRANHSNMSYTATVLSSTSIFCSFPDFGLKEIFMEIFMKVPSITSNDIVLSKNSIPFYYLCK